VNLLDVEAVIIGGGLGVRFGEPYVKRIRKAMEPHLFTDGHPPALHVAALGDFGGGIGAALMASTRGKKATRRTRAKTDAARADGAAAGAETPA
jgi:predicted NBD/HSP70 family sugar kinase